jgi:hypothetical protein
VRFARVGTGRGEYADSAVVAGRTIYRYVGPGAGAWRVGRALPAPEAHRLVAVTTQGKLGGFTLEGEGAWSTLDSQHLLDTGRRRRWRRRMAHEARGRDARTGTAGRTGVLARMARRGSSVRTLLATRARVHRGGLGAPSGADLEHPQRGEAAGWWRPGVGREFRFGAARLTTPDGYAGTRRDATGRWQAGAWTGSATWLDAEGRTAGARFGRGGRTRTIAEMRWTGAWLVPSVRGERERREAPGDTAAVEDRVEALDADSRAARRRPGAWRSGWCAPRREGRGTHRVAHAHAHLAGSVRDAGGHAVRRRAGRQRRDTRDERTGALVRQDLASTRLRGEWRPAGVSASLQVERTGEAENRRLRVLTFVGAGRGSYDATGNFVGTGDHDLVLVVSPELERFRTHRHERARRLGVRHERVVARFTRSNSPSRMRARRRGEGRWADAVLLGGRALGDAALARASVLQRLESELAPGSRPAFRLRAERRVGVDRTFENFMQATDQRTGRSAGARGPGPPRAPRPRGASRGSARRSRSRAVRAMRARSSSRVGRRSSCWQPDAALRAAAVVEATWSRAPGERTRTHLARGTGPVRHGGTRGARRPHRATCVRERRAARAAPERGPDRRGALGCDRTFRLAPA